MTASLPMYPFPEWRAAYEQLWEAVRAECPWLPALAPWGADPHELWRSPDLAVSQTCGWPLVADLTDRVRVVGTFRYRTRAWSGDHYRSVVVARDGGEHGDHAAVNGFDSLSGWVSLVWWRTGGPGGRWPGPVTTTGGHVASIEAVRDGAADVASIDAVTYAYAERHRPDLLAGVKVVGAGPEVPCLPVICSAGTTDARLAELRDALAVTAHSADPDLMIEGFCPLDLADYAPVASLAPRRASSVTPEA